MRVIYISISIILIDQISKLLVKGFSIPLLDFTYTGMEPGEKIQIIGDFFRLTFIENPGMAFGLDPGTDYKLIISLFSLIASIGLLYYMYYVRNESLSLRIALAFILGGAIGNLIDRTFYGILYGYSSIFHGKVVDFLDFDFFDITIFGRSYDRWPIFNVADSAVTIGVLILVFFYRHHNKAEEKETNLSTAETPSAQNDLSISDSYINEESKKDNPENDQPDKGKEI